MITLFISMDQIRYNISELITFKIKKKVSETVNFDLFLFSEFDTTEEFRNALTLVPL